MIVTEECEGVLTKLRYAERRSQVFPSTRLVPALRQSVWSLAERMLPVAPSTTTSSGRSLVTAALAELRSESMPMTCCAHTRCSRRLHVAYRLASQGTAELGPESVCRAQCLCQTDPQVSPSQPHPSSGHGAPGPSQVRLSLGLGVGRASGRHGASAHKSSKAWTATLLPGKRPVGGMGPTTGNPAAIYPSSPTA